MKLITKMSTALTTKEKELKTADELLRIVATRSIAVQNKAIYKTLLKRNLLTVLNREYLLSSSGMGKVCPENDVVCTSIR